MAITRTDRQQVFGPDGSLLSEEVVVLDVTAETNEQTIRQQALTALTTNRTYLALASPTNAQNAAEIKALARQMNGVIRLLLGQLDGTN